MTFGYTCPRAKIFFCLAIAGCAATLTAQNTQFSASVHASEIEERLLLAKSNRQQRDVGAKQEALQRDFTAKFNRLVGALAGFSKQYGEGKGAVWPSREAAKLREAMQQLLRAEEALYGAPRTIAVNTSLEPSARPR